MKTRFSIPVIFFILFILLFGFMPHLQFKEEQSQFNRVRQAYASKENLLSAELKKIKVNFSKIEILFLAFKEEKELQVWVRNKGDQQFQFFKNYPFCTLSGTLGPKRKMGDGQVPEGFYFIERFNPVSSFHLSLGLNYPNASDKIFATGNTGGDIFIHGNCVSIGCIPITDDKIDEVYICAVEAKNNGEGKIPVYIFPAKLEPSKMIMLKSKYKQNPAMLAFWENIQAGYTLFEKNKLELNYKIDQKGKYTFQE